MKMKYILALIAILYSSVSFAQNARKSSTLSQPSSGVNQNNRYQNGYVKPSTGTSVKGHYKTQTNSTNTDNYSTIGNTNPITGESGTKQPDYSIGAQQNSATKDIQTGPKGGQYYINSNGNKTYVSKTK